MRIAVALAASLCGCVAQQAQQVEPPVVPEFDRCTGPRISPEIVRAQLVQNIYDECARKGMVPSTVPEITVPPEVRCDSTVSIMFSCMPAPKPSP